MTTYLRAIPGQPIEHPCTVQMLAAAITAESEGQTSITSNDPTVYTGAPFYLFPVVENEPPEIDPRTERLLQSDPVLINGQWTQQWTVMIATEQEIALWDRFNAPPPNWLGFAAALNAHPTTLGLAAAAQENPAVLLLLNNLSVGLGQAAQGNPATFQAAWGYGVAAGAISVEMIAVVSALGAQFNLPGEFLAALQP